jgi:hypothetical protein
MAQWFRYYWLSELHARAQFIATGVDEGTAPHVKVFRGTDLVEARSFFPYAPGFNGGVRVAVGDVNGDVKLDIITAPGSGGAPQVKVFDGGSGAELRSFFAYDPAFTGGVYVAVGDINGDGIDDIVTGTGDGSVAQVKVFSGADLAVLRSFFPYGGNFTGGVRVAAGDVDGDGFADIITGTASATSHVKVFSGLTQGEIGSFFAYAPVFQGGVFVAAADVNEDGRADIITGAGAGGRSAREGVQRSHLDGNLLVLSPMVLVSPAVSAWPSATWMGMAGRKSSRARGRAAARRSKRSTSRPAQRSELSLPMLPASPVASLSAAGRPTSRRASWRRRLHPRR